MNLVKGFFIIILLIGIILLTVYFLSLSTTTNSEPKIIYKYLPRTLEEEETDPIFVSQIFKTMFTQPSVWIDSTYEDTIPRREVPNKYFISQF
jgi:hypothetical protein